MYELGQRKGKEMITSMHKDINNDVDAYVCLNHLWNL